MIRKTAKILIVLTLICSGVTGLAAFEGLNDVVEGVINGIPTVRGVSDSGVEVTVIMAAPEINPELELRATRLLNSFRIIPMKSIRVTVKTADSAELYISNGAFWWNNLNMGDYLPSGFTLKMNGVTDYDANVFIDKLHLRLEGYYASEEEFLDKMASVIEDPGTFLMSRDPEYILNTFMSMMSADEEIRGEVDSEIETRRGEIEETREMLTALKVELEELQSEITGLSGEKSELEADLAELKYNNLIMENRSLFGGIRMIDRKAVDWIVDEKTANPGASAEELMTGVLAATGAEVKSKQMTLILALYFGEYPE